MPEIPLVEPTVTPETREKPTTRRIPPYHVIIGNDDDHTMEFVVSVLRKVLAIKLEAAVQLMMEAHTKGRAVIWTGPREVAELKAEQVLTFHEVRSHDNRDLGPLTCTIEPAP
ncbi:MAG: ATP-dependent Clp protease adaptor ClpS [Gemmataceae bacterium]